MSNFKFDLQRFSVKTFTNQGQLVNLVTLDDIYEVSGGGRKFTDLKLEKLNLTLLQE